MIDHHSRLPLSLLTLIVSVATAWGSPMDAEATFGTTTHGGRGGEIIRVTNLNASGRGSLRQALWAEGPRIVVFEVGGVIDLEGKSLSVSKPFLTIAGQTAPSPGITLIRGGLTINTHDVVVQHLKVRPGDANRAKGSGWEVDAIGLYSARDVVIDHCSCTWATDENLSVSGPRFAGTTAAEWRENTSRNITISNCLIAEALSNSTHSKGEHSKGVLFHDNTTSILFFGNLFSSNKDRNPLAKGGTHAAIINNWIGNPGSKAISLGGSDGEEWRGRPPQPGTFLIVGNLFEHGPDTLRNSPVIRVYGGPVKLYSRDNQGFRMDGQDAPIVDGPEPGILDQSPPQREGLVILPVSELKEAVRKNVGARPWDRDAVDTRIIKAAVSHTGKIIDSQDEVGGYPIQEPTHSPFRADEWILKTMSRR